MRMKNVWRVICVTVFVFGAVSVFQAQKRVAIFQIASQPVDISDAGPAQSFVVEYIDSDVAPDGTVTTTGSNTRYVKANGEWRLLIRRNNRQPTSSEGPKLVSIYGGTPDGVFERKGDSPTRRYVSQSSDQTVLGYYRSRNYLRNHREFVRTDKVAGLEVYIFRIEISDPPNPLQWRETSYSAETGLTPLRTVMHLSDGSEIRQEAVSVEFKDVPEDLNYDLKNLPIAPKEKKNQ